MPSDPTSTNVFKDLCPFCFEDVGHFARHLLRKHSSEESVKKIFGMKLHSKQRRAAIIALRKKGNFVLQSEKKELRPVRRPVKSKQHTKTDDYFPCVNCLGFYKKTYLWRHSKTCTANLGLQKKECVFNT